MFERYHGRAITEVVRTDAGSRYDLRIRPRQVGLRIDLFEACSAFTRVTACTLALSPYFVTRLTEGFNHFVTSIVAPVLPAAAVAGWGLHPREKRRLITAHAKSGRSRSKIAG